jgi:leucine dehydrogenase
MEAALRLNRRTLEGLIVAVQGIGSVGQKLCHLLNTAGARLIVSDAYPDRVQGLAEALGATICAPEYILFAKADILSPCAMGGALNAQSIPKIQAKLIVGAANNQLAEAADAQRLAQQGVVYVPDYVANAGGIINAFAEFRGEADADVERRVRHIGGRVEDLLREAAASDQTPAAVAHQSARRLIEQHAQPRQAVA